MDNEALAFIEYLPTDADGQQGIVKNNNDVVILLHGLFGSAKNLSGIAKHLSRHYRVIGFDLPNHGRSPHTAVMTVASMAEQVLLNIQSKGIDRVNVLGHSLGGKVAMAMALAYPDIVDKLIVADIAPVDYNPRHDHILRALSELPLASMTSRSEIDEHLSLSISDLGTRQLLIQNVKKEANGFSFRINLPVIIESYDALSKGFELKNYAKAFEKPTLFIGGEKSNYIQPAFEAHMRSLFPNYQYQQIENAGHWLHVESAEKFNQLVSQFLMQVDVN